MSKKASDNIEKRRETVLELYKEHISQVKMASYLGVSVSTINGDIKALIREGKIFPLEEEITLANERRKKVKELWDKYQNKKKVAKELKIDVRVVERDLNYLWRKGIIKLQKPKRRKDISSRKNKKKTIDKNEADRKYFTMMISKIMKFYREGRIIEAITYLKTLNGEIELKDDEKKKLEIIRESLQKRLSPQGKQREENEQNLRKAQRKKFLERIRILNDAKIELERISRILDTSTQNVLSAISEIKNGNENESDKQKER